MNIKHKKKFGYSVFLIIFDLSLIIKKKQNEKANNQPGLHHFTNFGSDCIPCNLFA